MVVRFTRIWSRTRAICSSSVSTEGGSNPRMPKAWRVSGVNPVSLRDTLSSSAVHQCYRGVLIQERVPNGGGRAHEADRVRARLLSWQMATSMRNMQGLYGRFASVPGSWLLLSSCCTTWCMRATMAFGLLAEGGILAGGNRYATEKGSGWVLWGIAEITGIPGKKRKRSC